MNGSLQLVRWHSGNQSSGVLTLAEVRCIPGLEFCMLERLWHCKAAQPVVRICARWSSIALGSLTLSERPCIPEFVRYPLCEASSVAQKMVHPASVSDYPVICLLPGGNLLTQCIRVAPE